MNQNNEVKILDTERINLGKGFEIAITHRTEKYNPGSSSGYTEREIRPVFDFLTFRNDIVTNNYLDVIDLIEILRGFCGNRMISGKEYYLPASADSQPQLMCVTKPKKGDIYLFICIKDEKAKNVWMDKIECSQIAGKIAKILNSCAYPAPS